jgi:hypothetical protein
MARQEEIATMKKKTPSTKKRATVAKPVSGAKAVAIAASSGRSPSERVAAAAQAPLALCETDKNLESMLKVLRDREEPIEVRLAALQSLQAASFSVVAFESCRADYLAALREVATDPDPELRQRVLGVLSREKDGFAQKQLLEGLKDPAKQLVPPEKALQLLSYDVHSEAYPIARKIVANPPNPEAKREALRLLSGDAASAPIFEKVLRDKDELADIRQMSAAALHALRPETLRDNAREMILDKSEYPEIQATSLTALTQFGQAADLEKDKTLLKRVQNMTDKGPAPIKQTARRFLHKYGK